ncbi:MAG: hypothetical protein PHN57_00425 [Candidatus Omnitrophica bacterium]|nr:hypothetical protein [Candidatus Omnitrophota bacterium]
MRSQCFVLVIAALFFFGWQDRVMGGELAWKDISSGYLQFNTVLVCPGNPGALFAGTKNAVLKSWDDARNWRVSLLVKGQNRSVNFLAADPQDRNSLYAASGNGLYYSQNLGKNWQKVFRGKDYLSNSCTCILVLRGNVLLGTKSGLFVSRDKSKTWQAAAIKLKDSQIYSIVADPNEPDYIYLTSSKGVYKSCDSGNTWKRLIVAFSGQEETEAEEEPDQGNEEAKGRQAFFLTVDRNYPGLLYMASASGIFKSIDRGINWRSLGATGLARRNNAFLLVSSKSELLAASKSGVFCFDNGSWKELQSNPGVTQVNFLSEDSKGNFYAACENGLFRTASNHLTEKAGKNTIEEYSRNEPGIKDIQEAAIRYAEVEPGKIKLMREKAAKKAVLPQLNLGVNRNVTDLWHWESGSTTKADDDVLKKGEDALEWSVSLSWDFGELIWNNDQTSIDSRSRLMVQLRQDILDEVTKLYFERLRVKLELDNVSLEDRKNWSEKELKIAELTASLDALTGGYFSRNIR